MKRLAIWICIAGLALLLCAPAWGVTYEDSDRGVVDDEVRSYHNLEAVSWPESAMMEPQDRTSLQVRQSASMQQGWVRYRVQGAEQVSVRILTRHGSFFSVTDSGLDCGFGAYTTGLNPNSTELRQMQADPADGALYADTPFGWQALTVVLGAFHVLQDAQPPDAGRLVDYGLNVYAMSSETDAGTRVGMQRTGTTIIFNGYVCVCCAEEFTSVSLPADTQYIRVEINEMQPALQIDPAVRTSLSSVRFSGDNLVMGEPQDPEPVEPEPGPGDGDGDGGNGGDNGSDNSGGDGDGDSDGNGDGDGDGGGAGGDGGGTTGGGGGDTVYVYRYYRAGAGGQTVLVRETLVAEQAEEQAAAEWPDLIVGTSAGGLPGDWVIVPGDAEPDDAPVLVVNAEDGAVWSAGGPPPAQEDGGAVVIYDLNGEVEEPSLWKDLSAYVYIATVSGVLVVYLLRSKHTYK